MSRVTDEIYKRIFNGEFHTGDILPSQNELAHIFSVSVTVVREALGRLQSLGVIDASQGRRATIKKIDSQAVINVLNAWLQQGHGTIDDLYEVHFTLEGEIASIAAKKAGENDISNLNKIVDEMKGVETNGEKVNLDLQFHRLLAEITQNSIFVLLIDTLRGLFIEFQEFSFLQVGLADSYFNPHFAIFEAIRDHDSDAARNAMIDHSKNY